MEEIIKKITKSNYDDLDHLRNRRWEKELFDCTNKHYRCYGHYQDVDDDDIWLIIPEETELPKKANFKKEFPPPSNKI